MRKKETVKSACSGMTLIEVIMVMAILSVVMLAVMSLYIPAQRSTVVQTQVTDIQQNLQLAVNRLSHDLLTAGFLVTGQPILFESGTVDDPVDFTIRTRLVGGGFGRVASVLTPVHTHAVRLNLTNADMAVEFPENSLVRLIQPVTSKECNEDTVSEVNRIYQVKHPTVDDNGTPGDPSDDFTVIDLDDPNSVLAVGHILPETVVVRVANATSPAVQTIRYQFADSDGDGVRDALVRLINGNRQFLARNVSNISFVYTYNGAPTPRVQQVEITLSGQTKELVAGDAIASAKTRSLRTSVTLRNVF
jgi:prepilin-type N-terminal cleavage/methylation domain-containing protein